MSVIAFAVEPHVKRALEGLALALNHGLEPEQLRVYAFALADVPVEDIRAACVSLGKSERFWPKPVDIRETANRIAREKATANATRLLPPKPGSEPTYRCWRCQDSPAGWLEPMACPAIYCGKTENHAPHTFTARCPCWLERNAQRFDQRRQEAIQKGSTIPAECDMLAEVREGTYRWAKPY